MKINIDDTKYLNRDTDVKHKDILTIESEGKWQESVRFKKEDGTPQNEFKINFKLSTGDIRNTTLSWGNVKLLVQGLGDETSTWIDKEVRAWKTKSEKAKNGFVFLYVPVDWERDDTGEWIKPGDAIKGDDQTVKEEIDTVEYPEGSEENLDPEKIPF